MKKWLVAVSLLLSLSVPTSNALTLGELTKKARLDKGFVGVIYDKKADKTYLKIENLDQEFIYQTSLPSGLGSNDIGLDRGQLSDTRLAVFQQVGGKVLLVQKPTRYRALTKNTQEAAALSQAFASSVLWGFPLVDSGKGWALVDATEFVLQDIHGVGRRLESRKQGSGYKVDKSRSAIYMPRTTAFADNTEMEATITLVGSKPGEFLKQVTPNPYSVTVKMHHSFVRLPKAGYKPRKFYPKSGFFSVDFEDYASPINEPMTQRLIARHRLEKKNPKAKLSEAKEPIVYYLDPGVPEPVKSALKEGALWWNQAFEAIGYKDAFQVKTLPAGADPMDVRYNVIQWVHRATRGWSYGASVIDPRTGEIIKGHVTLGSLRVRQDYLIAQGMMAPFSKDENDQPLMDLALARIKQLSAHEVGHTLGLAHNFAASTYGRESVMDYPHPQFELQGNQIKAPNAYAKGMGRWDKSVIRYGYQDFPKGKEDKWLQQVIQENDSQGLLYVSDPDSRSPGSAHAKGSLWDNGSDPVRELERMTRIRAVALENFGAANLKNNQPWSDLEEILVPVYFFHRYQAGAVAKLIGGLEYDYSTKGGVQASQVKRVSGPVQNAALQSLLQTIKPEFLKLNPKVTSMLAPKAYGYSRSRESVNGDTGVSFDQIAIAQSAAQHSLSLLLNPQRLARVLEQSAFDPNMPSMDSIYSELHQQIIEQNYDGIEALIQHAVVDLIYSHYINLLRDKNVSEQVKMQVMGELMKEKEYLQRKLTIVRKSTSYYGFYAYQLKRLESVGLDDDGKLIEMPKVPPGSPI